MSSLADLQRQIKCGRRGGKEESRISRKSRGILGEYAESLLAPKPSSAAVQVNWVISIVPKYDLTEFLFARAIPTIAKYHEVPSARRRGAPTLVAAIISRCSGTEINWVISVVNKQALIEPFFSRFADGDAGGRRRRRV